MSGDNNDNDIVVPLAVSLGVGIPLILTIIIITWVTIKHRRMTREEDERFKEIDFEGDVTMSGDREDSMIFNAKAGDGVIPASHLLQYPHTSRNNQTPFLHRDDSSSYLYTPYVNDDAISIEDYGRSVNNLIGRSRTPAFAPQQQRLRHAHSESSVSITPSFSSHNYNYRGSITSSPLGPNHSRGQRTDSFASSQEWPPSSDILPPTANRGLRDSVVSSPSDQRHEPTPLFGASSGRPDSGQRIHEQQLLPSHHEEDELRAKVAVPSITHHDNGSGTSVAASNNSAKMYLERQSPSAESNINRSKSRGHTAVLDLYDVYRNKSKFVPRASRESRHSDNASTDNNSIHSDYDSAAYESSPQRRESADSTNPSSMLKSQTQSHESTKNHIHNISMSTTDYEEVDQSRAAPTSRPVELTEPEYEEPALNERDMTRDPSTDVEDSFQTGDDTNIVESKVASHLRNFSYESGEAEPAQFDHRQKADVVDAEQYHREEQAEIVAPPVPMHNPRYQNNPPQQAATTQHHAAAPSQTSQYDASSSHYPVSQAGFDNYHAFGPKEEIQSPVVDQLISQLPAPPTHYHPTSSPSSLRSASPHRSPQLELAATFDNFQMPRSQSSSSVGNRSFSGSKLQYHGPRETVLDDSVFMERTRKYDNARVR